MSTFSPRNYLALLREAAALEQEHTAAVLDEHETEQPCA